MSQLSVENLSKSYGSMTVLNKINLLVNPSEILVVIGPSGSGKTTLLLTILGFLKPDEGHIFINGKDIDELPINERNLGYMPQDFGLFPHLSTYDNVAFGLRTRSLSQEKVDVKVKEMLSLVDLNGMEQRKPNELSGGQKQRVSLARALSINPSLLLLDEPLSNVDEVTKDEVKLKMKETIKKTGVTAVCVMHDAEDALELSDKIAVMYSGQIIQCATPNELVEKPNGDIVRRLLHHLIKD